MRSSQKYVSPAVIDELITQFQLTKELPLLDVSSCDEVDEEFNEGMAKCLHKNPASRCTVRMCKYFEYCQEQLFMAQLVGWWKSTGDPRKVLPHHMAALRWSFFQYFARIIVGIDKRG